MVVALEESALGNAYSWIPGFAWFKSKHCMLSSEELLRIY